MHALIYMQRWVPREQAKQAHTLRLSRFLFPCVSLIRSFLCVNVCASASSRFSTLLSFPFHLRSGALHVHSVTCETARGNPGTTQIARSCKKDLLLLSLLHQDSMCPHHFNRVQKSLLSLFFPLLYIYVYLLML